MAKPTVALSKYKKYIGWILIGVYLVVVFAVVAYYEKDTPVKSYRVEFKDTLNKFVTEANIDSILVNEYHINKATLSELEMASIENRVEVVPGVLHAEIYSKLDGHVIVEIETEQPVVRVINANRKHYYITASGNLIPHSRSYVPRVPVASGHITRGYTDSVNLQAAPQGYGTLEGIFRIAGFIWKHKFWKAQIEQIYVNASGEYEMFPRVGAHVIVLGDTTQMRWKFRKLYALYEKGFKVKHWNRYEEINLKYGNQVVCSKR